MDVERVTVEADNTKTLRLKWPEGYDVEFRTGQFITMFWPDAPDYKRAYSLSSCALDRGHYEVTVKRDGKMGTRLVDWIRPGDRLMVIPPLGRFLPVYEPTQHLLCLAGGSGVTPFRGFVREASRCQYETRITILYSVRAPDDIIFRDEFLELERANPRFRFHVTCTRLQDGEPWTGQRGRISAAWIREHVEVLSRTTFYLCGSNAFVETVEQAVLNELKATPGQVRTEKWG